MNINKLYYLLAVSAVAVVTFTAWQIRTNAKSESRAIKLALTAERENYSLGEVIGITFDIENTSGETQAIAVPGIGAGNLRIFVSRDGHHYSRYLGPDAGRADSGRQQLKLGVGESFEVKSTLLYNRRTPTEHLSSMYADQIKKDRIDTDFAMLEPGHYWLKATYTNGRETFRSESVEIEITQPVGSDAVVWEQIKSDGAFAYFLHTGDVLFLPGSNEEVRFNEKLRQIATDYPGAELTKKLDENLDTYNRNIEHLQRLLAERESAK